jgi:hypothetical protein
LLTPLVLLIIAVISDSSNTTDYCSNIPVIFLITAVVLLCVAALLNSKLNYLEITVGILITATEAVIFLSQSSSRSHSNVTSPR